MGLTATAPLLKWKWKVNECLRPKDINLENIFKNYYEKKLLVYIYIYIVFYIFHESGIKIFLKWSDNKYSKDIHYLDLNQILTFLWKRREIYIFRRLAYAYLSPWFLPFFEGHFKHHGSLPTQSACHPHLIDWVDSFLTSYLIQSAMPSTSHE